MPNDSAQDERNPASASRAMHALREVIRAFNVATKRLERRHGVSGSQLETLELLRETPGLSPSDIAARSATDQSTASVVVKRLAERGYVERRRYEGDRRRTRLSVTAEGEALLDKMPATVTARLREAFMRMTLGDRTTLTHLLERWLAFAGLRRV